MAHFSIVMALVAALLLSAHAREPDARVPDKIEVADKSICQQPELASLYAEGPQRSPAKGWPWPCSFRNTCRGFCIHDRAAWCRPDCRGCSHCKGCTEHGACNLSHPCRVRCRYFPCIDKTICWCSGSYLDCRSAPIRPWCSGLFC